uniref:FG-GAP repeat domain-containing protein n=1 Tax=Calothrix rhizosoleniae TaxID=888997 RepID=UPI001178BCC8
MLYQDFNGDGRADILWRNSNTGENYLWMMNGTTIIRGGSLFTVNASGWYVDELGDFNGDNRADILWRNSSTGENYMWMMDGNTIIDSGSLNTVNASGWYTDEVGDFNGDG